MNIVGFFNQLQFHFNGYPADDVSFPILGRSFIVSFQLIVSVIYQAPAGSSLLYVGICLFSLSKSVWVFDCLFQEAV